MIREAIALAVEGSDLSSDQMREVWEEITGGQATSAQIASLITALRVKGETVEEITAAAEVMRRKATRIEVFPGQNSGGPGPSAEDSVPLLVDTCGTGGDRLGTFNISTCTAFVIAAAGVHVAKHGNRSVSSACGSADVCEALGANLSLTPEQTAASIRETGIGFLFAPALHGTMKHAVGPRKEIGIRTIFNILGPLSNPAGAEIQILGVYSEELTAVLASVLGRLGSRRALVVHGEDGMDEITTTGKTTVSEFSGNGVRTYSLHPEDFGLPVARLDDLRGATAGENARLILDLLQGKTGPHRDIVLLNAGAALYVAGVAPGVGAGIEKARQTIEEGKALRKLRDFVAFTNR